MTAVDDDPSLFLAPISKQAPLAHTNYYVGPGKMEIGAWPASLVKFQVQRDLYQNNKEERN